MVKIIIKACALAQRRGIAIKRELLTQTNKI
jgi:hypothetical protein